MTDEGLYKRINWLNATNQELREELEKSDAQLERVMHCLNANILPLIEHNMITRQSVVTALEPIKDLLTRQAPKFDLNADIAVIIQEGMKSGELSIVQDDYSSQRLESFFMSNNTENRTPHQTMIELCNRVQELALKLDGLQSRMQTEQVARVKAERVISLIAHSTTGDYDWCREVCQKYLEG